MKLLMACMAGAMFSASFTSPQIGLLLAGLAALCVGVYHIL